MEGATTTLIKPASGKDDRSGLSDAETKRFTFDYSYNSFLPKDDPNYASQETVWDDLGTSVLDSAWEGYNVSLFARSRPRRRTARCGTISWLTWFMIACNGCRSKNCRTRTVPSESRAHLHCAAEYAYRLW